MLRRSWTRLVIALPALVLLPCSMLSAAVPANETLLPKTTKGAVLIHDVDELAAAFDKTQMGQLINDPLMQPFIEDFKKQMKSKMKESRGELGISWDDLQDISSGEVAIARAAHAEGKSATIVLADVTGNIEKTEALLEKISAALVKKKATKSAEKIEGVDVTAFEIPPTRDIRFRRYLYYAINNNLLVVAADKGVMSGILKRQASKDDTDSLAKVPAFRKSLDRATRDAGDVVPHVRFFIEPIAYFQAVRDAQGGKKKRGTDMLKIARTQGFDAIKGVAGVVNFALDKYEVLYRVSIYAPPIKDAAPDRYRLAMRMMSFFNDMKLDPPTWVHTELATFSRVKLKIPKTFEASKTIVDAIAGAEDTNKNGKIDEDESVFDEVLKSIKTAPDGPKVDIRNDVVMKLGDDVVVLSDYVLPITVTSERLLFAIKTTDSEALAKTVAKYSKADTKAHRREFKVGDKTHIIWEMVEEEPEDTSAPVVELGGIPGLPGGDEEEDEDEEEEPLMPNKAVTVAYGHLMIASHIEFLHKVLENADKRARLADAVDFKLVATEIERLGGSNLFVRNFSRTDEEYRPTYELIKQGRMPESKTMLGMMLNKWLGADLEKDELRVQQIDGSKLPDYEVCRRYLGPAGMYGTAEDDGWFIGGFVLSKQNPSALQSSGAVVAEKQSEDATR